MVGIPRPAQRVDAYSFELSGGLRQRVMIALALAAEPRILIADEPTTALDVTTQAQILELIRRIQQERGLAVILITHDMGVIAEMADDVVVMYLGHEVEKGPVDAIFHAPRHPYTRSLLRSIPSVLAEPRARLATIAGSIPHPYARPTGLPVPSPLPGSHRRRLREDISRGNADWRGARRGLPPLHRPGRRRRMSVEETSSSPCGRGPGRWTAAPILDVRRLRKILPHPPRPARPPGRPGARRRRRELHHRPRRNPVAGRRVRLRQDHHIALHPARHHADRRRDPFPHLEAAPRSTSPRSPASNCARCGGRCR